MHVCQIGQPSSIKVRVYSICLTVDNVTSLSPDFFKNLTASCAPNDPVFCVSAYKIKTVALILYVLYNLICTSIY